MKLPAALEATPIALMTELADARGSGGKEDRTLFRAQFFFDCCSVTGSSP
jgi:hypothetical protein